VTQPTCALPTGEIVYSSNAGEEYSIDGGTIWQVSSTFVSLAPGNFTAIARLVSDNTCISTPSVSTTINPAPTAPGVPTATITAQPTCALPSGSIDITAPLGAFEYAMDGGTYQPSINFTAVAPGNHSFTARLISDITCVSPVSLNYTINPAPVPPSVPTVNTVTQPTCAISTGEISYSTFAGEEYSIDGGASWQMSSTFTLLGTGTYSAIARLIADNACMSTASVSVAINSVPAAPLAPVVASVTQPTCAIPLGEIVYSTGAGEEYSIDGGTVWQVSSTFATLLPGSYSAIARLASDNTCISVPSVSSTINASPSAPVQPTGFTGPTSVCDNTSNVTYTVANDVNATNYLWSFTGAGATLVGTTSFVNVDYAAGATSGILEVIAINTCGNSPALSIPIAVGTTPGTTLNAAAVQDTLCVGIDGIIQLSSTQLGVSYRVLMSTVTLVGPLAGTGAAMNIPVSYTALNAGTNTLDIEVSSAGCIATQTFTAAVQIDKSVLASSNPVFATAATTLCTGTPVVLEAPANANHQYTWYQNSSEIITQNADSLAVLVPGDYTLKVTDNFKCSFTSAPITVNVGIAAPVVTVAAPSSLAATLQVSAPVGMNVQWYAMTTNGNKMIINETTNAYTAYYDGGYFVIGNMNGCYIASNQEFLSAMSAGSLERNLVEVDQESIYLPVPDLNADLTVYPNPNNGSFELRYFSEGKEEVVIRLHDGLGKEVFFTSMNQFGILHIPVSLTSDIARGIYQLVIQEGDKQIVRKVTIQ
jgi:hypothetical protein